MRLLIKNAFRNVQAAQRLLFFLRQTLLCGLLVSCQSGSFRSDKPYPYPLKKWAGCQGLNNHGIAAEVYIWNKSSTTIEIPFRQIQLIENDSPLPVKAVTYNLKHSSGAQSFSSWKLLESSNEVADPAIALSPNDAIDFEFQSRSESPEHSAKKVVFALKSSADTETYHVEVSCPP